MGDLPGSGQRQAAENYTNESHHHSKECPQLSCAGAETAGEECETLCRACAIKEKCPFGGITLYKGILTGIIYSGAWLFYT